MEMIATSKMRRTQEQATKGRPYANKMRELLANLASAQPRDGIHPLFQRRPVSNIAVILFTSDRGLCGGLNSNVNRMTSTFALQQSIPINFVAVGKKGRDFMARSDQKIEAEFIGVSDRPSVIDISPISRIIIDDYGNGLVDQVYLAYSKFVSTVVQQPVLEELLPIETTGVDEATNVDYIYEPNAATVLAELLPRYVEMQIYHALLEAIASEQSARMVAMRNATDNANDMIQDLTLVLNKARQEMITKELLDITSGMAVSV